MLHTLEREEQKRAKTRLVRQTMEWGERVKPKRACRPNNGDEGSEEGGKTRPTSHFLGRGERKRGQNALDVQRIGTRGTLLFHLPYHRHPRAGAERIGGE